MGFAFAPSIPSAGRSQRKAPEGFRSRSAVARSVAAGQVPASPGYGDCFAVLAMTRDRVAVGTNRPENTLTPGDQLDPRLLVWEIPRCKKIRPESAAQSLLGEKCQVLGWF